MRILPISNANIRYNKTCTYKPSFKARPDFQIYNCTASCYFRRGSVLLSCAKGYEKIESLFKQIFNSNMYHPKKMLIIGIGKSQEPFSYLASIGGIAKGRTIKDCVDLYSVDLQSKPSHLELKESAFCDLLDYQTFPKYAKDCFVKDNAKNWLEIKKKEEALNPINKFILFRDKFKELKDKGYSIDAIIKMAEEERKQKPSRWRVNDEIFNFLEETYNNPEKSKWECGIQDVIYDYPNKEFDVISANNVIPYITAFSRSEAALTIKNMIRTLKPKGYIITDPYEEELHVKEIKNSDNMKQIFSGIYQKICG